MVMQMGEQSIIDLLREDDYYRGVVARYLIRHAGCAKDAYPTVHTCVHCGKDFDYRTGYNA